MSDIKGKTACFTGHRIIPPEELPMVKANLRNVLIECIEKGYKYFGTGGALGFDTLAANIVLDLKNDNPHIRLILVLPCLEQTRGWRQADVEEYERIKSKADKVVYTSKHYFNGCMHKRNRHLVDNSSLCICYYKGVKGGTRYTLKYAKQRGLSIIDFLS